MREILECSWVYCEDGPDDDLCGNSEFGVWPHWSSGERIDTETWIRYSAVCARSRSPVGPPAGSSLVSPLGFSDSSSSLSGRCSRFGGLGSRLSTCSLLTTAVRRPSSLPAYLVESGFVARFTGPGCGSAGSADDWREPSFNWIVWFSGDPSPSLSILVDFWAFEPPTRVFAWAPSFPSTWSRCWLKLYSSFWVN